MSNFHKHTGHLYTVLNQNGFNNALYDHYGVEDPHPARTKEDVRKMVQNWPDKYPCSIVIIDLSFECNRVYVEVFDMKEEVKKL